MINLILFGPPGSGKGTQSIRIAKKFGLNHLSTGDIFREEIEKESVIGKKVKKYIEEGQLVPDELVIDVLFYQMHQYEKPLGFIFDGFPRTVTQAEILRKRLAKEKLSITTFISLEVEDYNLIQRIVKRGKYSGRVDDNQVTILERLKVYKENTLPLKDFYKDHYKFTAIDGAKKIEEVFEDISAILQILVNEERVNLFK